MDELVNTGRTRREAMRQVARENMGEEVREGLSETLQQGSLPGCARACGAVCGALLVVLFVAALVLSACVCICCGALHLCGWFLTWWLLGCDHQKELRLWLLIYQSASLIEAFTCSLMRGCAQKVVQALDSRVRPGFARACGLVYAALSFGCKVLWCVHVRVLVARKYSSHSDKEEACGHWLPRFMGWYSCVLLLQLLVVEPALRAGMGLALTAATRGLLQTARGAKPGTMDDMQEVAYEEELFAKENDPSDDRPQRECCICLQEYEPLEGAIVKTPCRHYMHRDCLARWLQTSHFCPICRGDLEEQEGAQEVDLELLRR